MSLFHVPPNNSPGIQQAILPADIEKLSSQCNSGKQSMMIELISLCQISKLTMHTASVLNSTFVAQGHFFFPFCFSFQPLP